jgi:hypothetical protein
MPVAARAHGVEWLAIQRSIEEARGGWTGLMLGATGAQGVDVALLALAGARAAGLRPRLVATESAPDRFARLQERLQAEGLAPGAARLVGGAIAAEPARATPGTTLAQDLVGEEAAWDLVRVGLRSVVAHLLTHAEPLLTARVRWLVVATHGRGEEGMAIRVLDGAGWRLMAERPALLDLAAPRRAQRHGTQVWRGPLA